MIVLSVGLVLCIRRQKEFDFRANLKQRVKWRNNHTIVGYGFSSAVFFLIKTSFNGSSFAILQYAQAQKFLLTFSLLETAG